MKSFAILAFCIVIMASCVSGRSEHCSLCDVVLSYVNSKLGSHASEQEVKSAFKAVCHDLPHSLQDSCRHFVKHYADSASHYINDLTPDEICARLNLCGAKLSETKAVENKQDCSVCKLVFTMIDRKLTTKRTFGKIEQVLDKICDKLPNSVSSQCTVLVKKYGPIAIKYIVAKARPKDICTKLTLCSAAKPGDRHHKHELVNHDY